MMPSVPSVLTRTGSSSPPAVAGTENEPPAAKGVGPRIYVGGIPNALSQTMIKNHFNHYGKVVDVYFPKHPVTSQRQAFCFVTFSTRKAANAAVSQSNRKINGHQVSSIASTADRPIHHRFPGQQTSSPPQQATIPCDALPQQQSLYGMYSDHIAAAPLQTTLQPPTAAHSTWTGHGSPPGSIQSSLGPASAPELYGGLSGPADPQQWFIYSQAALALMLAANGQNSAQLPNCNLATNGNAPAWDSEDLLLSQPSMARYDAPFGRASSVDSIAARSHALELSGLPAWAQARDALTYLSVHDNYGNDVVPNIQNVQLADSQQQALETCLRFGPQRHANARDIRHSPY